MSTGSRLDFWLHALTSAFSDSGYWSGVMTDFSMRQPITRASFDVRAALHREGALNRDLGQPADHRWPSTNTVLDGAVTSLVEAFLFCDEAPLAEPIEGSTTFAAEFAARVLTELNYVGVLTIEWFQDGPRLLANEMAPRVAM